MIQKINQQKDQQQDQQQDQQMPQIEIDGELMEQCGNCGNIWDGNAQCNCWQMNYYQDDANDTGYETE